MSTKLPVDVKTDWVDALRSGKYNQVQGFLNLVESETKEPGHCCLGVLCEVLIDTGRLDIEVKTEDYKPEFVKMKSYDDMGGTLSHRILNYLGQDKSLHVEYGGNLEPLTHLNDTGLTFEEIADLIEEQL